MSEKNKELLLIFTQYSETFVAMIKLSSVQGCHECQSGGTMHIQCRLRHIP